MKGLKAKWTALLAAIGCFAVCLGVGVAYIAPSESSGIVAQAETTYTINKFDGGTGSSNASTVYAYCNDKDWDGHDWPVLTFVEDSGNGFTWNGSEAFTPNAFKWAGQDFYIELGKTAAAGDYFTVDGTFYVGDEYVKFNNCTLKYNGSVWESYTYINYTTHELGALQFSKMEPDKLNMAYFVRLDGEAIPIKSTENNVNWTTAFDFLADSGVGITLNGQSITPTLKFPNEAFIEFSATPNKDDILVIGGTFYSKSLAVKYVITESKFQWNGTEWVDYVEYTPYNLGSLAFAQMGNENKFTYLKRADGEAITAPDDDNGGWTATFTKESGVGITLNNNPVTPTLKFPGAVFLEFGSAPSQGDILVIGGTFVNEDTKTKYVIEESKFQWNGTEWVDYVEYATHNIGALVINSPSTNGKESTRRDHLYTTAASTLPFNGWENPFVLESGDGLKVNGESKSIIDMQSADGVWFAFEGVNAGDVVSISGTFVCEKQKLKYVIDESKFIWAGAVWVNYAEYTEYNVGRLLIAENSSASAVYYKTASGIAFEKTDGEWNEKLIYGSGIGITLNGAQRAFNNNDIKIPGNLYVGLGTTAKTGDVLVIGGAFYNANLKVKYVIEESTFTWSGAGWINDYQDSELASYDVVSLSDLGIGLSKTVAGVYDGSGLTYTQSANNTTGSVKFRFQVNSENTSNGEIAIRLRGSAWSGVRFHIGDGVIKTWNNTATAQSVALSNNTDYVIELGAIDTLDGKHIWTYISINGTIMVTEELLKTDTSGTDGEVYSTYNTNAVSLYVSTTNVTFTDPDHVSIAYTSSCGSTVDYVEKNSSYTILPIRAKTYDTFIGWVVNGELYFAGDTITVGAENITATALEIDFRLQDGAAIRLAGTSDESGIRFTTLLKETDLNALIGYGASVSYGTLIIPYDYLAYNQKPNLADFTPDTDILKIASTATSTSEKWEVIGGDVVYRGAMQKLYEENYERLFAGRGYMEITLNGKTITVYTPFNEQNNVRSIRQVSQAFKADTTEPAEGEIRYATISDTQKGIVDTYAAVDTIDLMDYASYAANNFLNIIAWNYPKLDESNEYNNDKNKAIATQMKNTGIKVVNLTGKNLLVLDSKENIEKTRQIIEFFWSQGLQTVAFAANNFENTNVDFTEIGTPDFSDCEGFIGFLHWDEPTENDDIMSKLADLAIQFNQVYAGTDVTYMNNLLPSYAPYFQKESSGFFGSSTTLDKAAYKAYVEEYCTKVLLKVKGQKWLSVDSYPINADYSLHDTFLFDLGVIKYYAMQNDAHAHVALQSSGFTNTENGDDTKSRIPTEAEMRMQAYAAMAFGMDSISWFTYSPSGSESETFYTFVDNDGNIIEEYKTAYDAFTAVNKELEAIGAVYSAFDWKGVILGAGNDNTTKIPLVGTILDADEDYNAFATVMGQIGDYELSASDTKHLSSVKTNKTNWNYLMGVMEDANGNEGYVLCNYNSHEEDRAQTITITFNKNVTEVLIYGKNYLDKNGKPTPVSVSNQKLTVTLATGEGVIILPSKLG